MTQTLVHSLTQSLLAHTGQDEEEYNPFGVKSQIICTIGPNTNNPDTLAKMIEEGMSIARMNFSHGNFNYHRSVIENVREVSEGLGITVGIMLDTKGPEIRTGKFSGDCDNVDLVRGETFTFVPDENYLGDQHSVGTTYANLPKVLSVGNQILVDDGLLSFTVQEITDEGAVICRVDNSGNLGQIKGVNLPGVVVDLPAVTEKDIADINWGVEQNVDMIAASFIRKAEDVLCIRKLCGHDIQIISKIESQEGLDNFNEILAVSDGIMVARGDLGVEIPIYKVATAQKMMIRKCNEVGKPVITATQMLESMITYPRPTRAEATDVANAVFDGSDCVMLSGETAKGKYPCEAVHVMSQICFQAEGAIDYRSLYRQLRSNATPPVPIPDTIASSAVKTSWDISAKVIICLTDSGNTARLVSKYRPASLIIAVTSSPRTSRQLLISRACVPYLVPSMKGTEGIVAEAAAYAERLGLLRPGDRFVVTSGLIESESGSTNIMQVKTYSP
eukprot:CAMPEP_0174276540 /NCGR_PEP_ID=MMETSP0439-20130205/60446_1 /TAXON_ID=0 /ORGANISM="Stereomyxa ramosa, Strain Chinc5" /LENGTH=502 /DNA_ID=CAMNT_0015368783 /DNA_START=865 /DNA_END=2373 /DNA_ORIENTATION=+